MLKPIPEYSARLLRLSGTTKPISCRLNARLTHRIASDQLDETKSAQPNQPSTVVDHDSTSKAQSLSNSFTVPAQEASKNWSYSADEVVPVLKPSKVPASQLGRLFHYGSLAVGLGAGAASEFVRRAASSNPSPQNSVLMSEANVNRLVDKLSKMRGAALKLGQFLSIQDANVLPEQVEIILRRVQGNANYMPNYQMEKVMQTELGSDWKSLFSEFNPIPIASASIGQVHAGRLASTNAPVAIKIQFPNVASSIASDINTISLLLTTSSLLPKGLFLDSTIKAMKVELDEECDYIREASCAAKFGEFLKGDSTFRVMQPMIEYSTCKVLVMEKMEGEPLVRASRWDQDTRNEIGASLLSLCLRELFQFRLMQTDPNWSNFLYNHATRQIELIDFGATREYSKTFIDNWLRLLRAAVSGDREACIEHSLSIGYLTGQENEAMIDAHVNSMSILGTPFRPNSVQPFDFGSQTITDDIRALIPVMLRNRLTPPPRETYSLNRKLSGAILLCGRLSAKVDCRRIWDEVTGDYVFD